MHDEFNRTEQLFGTEAMARLQQSRVAIFGVGGVGGYVVEILARSGIGHLTLVDNDTVEASNINRQLVALHSTVGMAKTDVAERRIHDINPHCEVTARRMFFLPGNANLFNFKEYDYVVDCVDTVAAKIALICCCKSAGTPIISAMGAGNKRDASAFRVADIAETSIDPLARVLRKRLRKQGIEHLKVVFSTEQPAKTFIEGSTNGRHAPASNAFAPAACGLLLAAEVVNQLTDATNYEP